MQGTMGQLRSMVAVGNRICFYFLHSHVPALYVLLNVFIVQLFFFFLVF